MRKFIFTLPSLHKAFHYRSLRVAERDAVHVEKVQCQRKNVLSASGGPRRDPLNVQSVKGHSHWSGP